MTNDENKQQFALLLNPVVLIAVLILMSVFALIGSAMVGFDKGVLVGMSKVDFARGLITYLFAVVTIGTAVVLVVSALIAGEGDVHERRFQRGKEILSLLLGVFGTIVGFYFGSEVTAKAQSQGAVLTAAPLHLSSSTIASGAKLTLTTVVSGGHAPYTYGVEFGDSKPELNEVLEQPGWLTKDVVAPPVSADQSSSVKVSIQDSDGHLVQLSAPVTLKPH